MRRLMSWFGLVALVVVVGCTPSAPPYTPPVPVPPTPTPTPVPVVASLPAAPTRVQVLAAHLTFQGLTVTCPEIGGAQPWFEPAITTVSASCQAAVYAAKHAAGDTTIILDEDWSYNDAGVPTYMKAGRNLSADPQAFRAAIQDAIVRGGFDVVYVMVGGDNGYAEAMTNLQALVPVLAQAPSLLPYCVLLPGFDSIIGYNEGTQSFGPWTLAQVSTWLTTARSLDPQGYVGIEPSADEPLMCRLSQFITPQAWAALDIVLEETNNPHSDGLWQNAARALCGAWRRPPDEPKGDDPSPPCDWGPATPRGPVAPIGFEWGEYQWVRNRLSPAQVQTTRAYIKAMGFSVVD